MNGYLTMGSQPSFNRYWANFGWKVWPLLRVHYHYVKEVLMCAAAHHSDRSHLLLLATRSRHSALLRVGRGIVITGCCRRRYRHYPPQHNNQRSCCIYTSLSIPTLFSKNICCTRPWILHQRTKKNDSWPSCGNRSRNARAWTKAWERIKSWTVINASTKGLPPRKFQRQTKPVARVILVCDQNEAFKQVLGDE